MLQETNTAEKNNKINRRNLFKTEVFIRKMFKYYRKNDVLLLDSDRIIQFFVSTKNHQLCIFKVTSLLLIAH